MAILYKDDVEKTDKVISAILEKEETESQKIIEEINDFTSLSTNKLKGEAWDKERNKLSLYLNAFEKRKNIANLLSSAVKDADKIMLNYIDQFPSGLFGGLKFDPNVIDTACINELNAEISRAQTHIANAKKSNGDKDIDYYQNVVDDCKTLALYIEKLSSVDADAYGKFEAVAAEMASFISLVGEINASMVEEEPSVSETPIETQAYVPSYRSVSNMASNNTKTQVGKSSSSVKSNNNSLNNSEISSNSKPSSMSVNQDYSQTKESQAKLNIQEKLENNSVKTSNINSSKTVIDTNDEKVKEATKSIDETKSNIIESIGNTIKNDDQNNDVITDSTVSDSKNNNLKTIGLVTAGAAAVGAAAYGTYDFIKKDKREEEHYDDGESNQFDV